MLISSLKHLRKTCLPIIMLASFQFFSQGNNQIADEPFAYKVNGHIPIQLFNNKYEIPTGETVFLGKYKYNLVGNYKVNNGTSDISYVLLQLAPFKYKTAPQGLQKSVDSTLVVPKDRYSNKKPFFIKKSPERVDIEEQDGIYVIEMGKFQYQLDEGFIRKEFETSNIRPDWGASFSVPFKIRPSVNDLNMKITPELTLGGFVGLKKRINRYKPHYWYFPVVTAGVTIIGINKDNVIVEQDVSGVKDGLVFARTATIGSIIQLNDFQLGFVFGWDKPGGEIARDWIYNDRLWYSFSIGFDFINREEKKVTE